MRLNVSVFALLLTVSTIIVVSTMIVKVKSTYNYYIEPDFPDNTKIPVNVEYTLSATIKRFDGRNINESIAVEVKLQWETYSKTYYSEINTGKVVFSVRPTSSFSRLPQSITFSSQYFETKTAYVICVPAVTVEAVYDKVQHIDPLTNKDIVLLIRAKETESGSIIINPSSWEIVSIILPSGAPTGTIVNSLPPYSIATGLFELDMDINNDYTGVYTIQLKVYYSDYFSCKSSFTLNVQAPIVSTKFLFESGENITITPDNAGSGVEVKRGCPYFDIVFTDFRSNPLSVTVASIDVIIVSPTGMSFSRTNGQVNVEQINSNTLRVHFYLTESWYQISLKHLTGGLYIGGYIVNLDQNYVKVATVSSGFNIWDFIFSPYIFVPIVLVLAYLILKGGKKKQTEV